VRTQRISAVFAAACLAGLMAPALAQSPSGIPGVVAPGVEPQLVQDGFVFTEGPVATAEGTLYFSDIRANRTYLLEIGRRISVARENTNGANGLALTKEGDLLAAEGDGKRISRIDRAGKVTTVVHGSEDRPFLAPNDLIVDAKGGIYFTDPGPRPVVPGRIVHVYYLPPGAKEPIVIDDKIARPNGLTITADGKTLIVDDTLGTVVFAYDIQTDGTVANKRTFANLRHS
jgi:gluconolactonase